MIIMMFFVGIAIALVSGDKWNEMQSVERPIVFFYTYNAIDISAYYIRS